MEDKSSKIKNIIEVKSLSKTFGELKAVKDISFHVKEGEIFAFLGPNGAGKSTTLKMLTTILEPTSGTITLNGFDVVHQGNDVRKSFGIVFQDPSLDDDLTAMENMEIHGALYNVEKSLLNTRIKQLLEIVELWDRKDDLVKHFSGGMKRRLEIARGLLHHPRVLFLDEPTIGLDPQTRNHIWSYVKDLNKKEGITIFFTTHYMEEADKIAQRISVIDHGKIIGTGTSKELKAKTKTRSLEDAFIKMTGNNIRVQEASAVDHLRTHVKMVGRR